MADDGAAIKPVDIRFTFETLALPGDEEMGLLGGNYLLRFSDRFYGGLGAYGALTGERGGFFTGGLALGYQLPLSQRLALDIGGFVGGGGGGSAPQGGGLMLRPHLSLMHRNDDFAAGLSVSRVDFPNGDIGSTQWSLVLEKRFYAALFPPSYRLEAWPEQADRWRAQGFGAEAAHRQLALELRAYVPQSGSNLTGGAPHRDTMGVVGVEWRQLFSEHYLSLATYGAMHGGVDGFAQVMAGGGLYHRFASGQDISLGLTLGAAGGGEVDTGGGLVLEAVAGWSIPLRQRLDLSFKAGVLTAPDGDFSAATATLSAAYRYDALTVAKDRAAQADGALQLRHWRWRTAHESYFVDAKTLRKNGAADGRRVDLIGVMLDVMVTQNSYLTGQALGAYDGGAGGYAVGLVGAGYQMPLIADDFSLGAELTAGASGGGGLAVGHGIITQPMLFARYKIAPQLELEAGYGRMIALSGDFDPAVWHLALNYRYATLYRAD
ncbi:MAG: hypothetical protein AB1810_03895 [Pseudomonadota bacterium]